MLLKDLEIELMGWGGFYFLFFCYFNYLDSMDRTKENEGSFFRVL